MTPSRNPGICLLHAGTTLLHAGTKLLHAGTELLHAGIWSRNSGMTSRPAGKGCRNLADVWFNGFYPAGRRQKRRRAAALQNAVARAGIQRERAAFWSIETQSSMGAA